MAGDRLSAALGRHEGHQETFVAGMCLLRITEVQTGGRVLKYRSRFPGSSNRAAIPALFEKVELGLQGLEHFPIIRQHVVTSTLGDHCGDHMSFRRHRPSQTSDTAHHYMAPTSHLRERGARLIPPGGSMWLHRGYALKCFFVAD